MACIYNGKEFVKILPCHLLSKNPKTNAVRKYSFTFCSPASQVPSNCVGN